MVFWRRKRHLTTDEAHDRSIEDASAFFTTESSCMGFGRSSSSLALPDGAVPKGKAKAKTKAKAKALGNGPGSSKGLETFPPERKATPESKLTSVVNKTGNLITKLTSAQIQLGKDPMAKALVSSIKAKIEELSKSNRCNMKADKGKNTALSDVNKIVATFNKHAISSKELLAKARPFVSK